MYAWVMYNTIIIVYQYLARFMDFAKMGLRLTGFYRLERIDVSCEWTQQIPTCSKSYMQKR